MQNTKNANLIEPYRGKLTVFLGAAPGVGKTYAMLKTALDRKHEGVDTLIGWVDAHSSPEISRMVAEFPAVFPNAAAKNNLAEMDIDAIIAHKPALVLVDDLALVNPPGARHVRRYQDVEELLAIGINVYTTLNVQHIESLNDVVAQITGILEKETVPDYILERAASIQLIDIPTEDLLKRFQEGYIHITRGDDKAARHFFRAGNIDALRELTLRFTASKVDQKLNVYMREHNITGPWPASSRVMVCVGVSPFSADLIRAARRLAAGFHGEWLAVHIETPTRIPLNDQEKDLVARNMRLAEELGAKTVSISGSDLTASLLEAAYRYNVTAIVVGKPRHSRLWEFFHGAVVDKLIRKSRGINIYVIQPPPGHIKNHDESTAVNNSRFPWLHYCGGLLMTALLTTLCYRFQSDIEFVNIALLYQLPVILSAFWWGRWPSYFTAVVSMLCFDFLFVPPLFTFSIYDWRFIWSFITFLIVAFVIGGRTERLRYEARSAHQRERSTHALFEFTREISAVIDRDTIIRELITQISTTLDQKAIVLLPDEQSQLHLWKQPPSTRRKKPDKQPVQLDYEREKAAALWAFNHKQSAGHCTNTMPETSFLYIPLIARGNVMGVLGVQIAAKLTTPEERRLLDAWAGLAAVAIERVNLAEKEREASLLIESDRLRTALLNSVSHELKTPLSFIIGSTSSLLDTETTYSEDAKQELLESIKEGANRMERIVANLLDTARIESGMMHLKNDWCDMEDIIGTALRRLTDQLKNRSLIVDISVDTPLLRADCVLLEQVIINLLDNALKYSPPQSPLQITVSNDDQSLQVSIADKGIGIPETELARIFDKFYRVQQRTVRASGTGLGLSICKSIIEAHQGRIWAENRPEGGSVFSFSLPLSEPFKEEQ